MSLPPAIFLMGPTAAGKTDLALELTSVLPCELISVDSALIYKGMDIGTAKPSAEILAKYPHRLIDILDPAQSYSAAEFRRDALEAMADITARGKIPLLVGGTMLYYKALLEGLAHMPAADAAIRAELEQQALQYGLQALHDQLQAVDPVSAARIHPNDPQRLIRALEVFRVSGKSLTEHYAIQKAQTVAHSGDSAGAALPYTVAHLAIAPAERKVLHQRIAQRFLAMVEQGFVAEVEGLFARDDLHKELPSIRSVGYRQAWEYLEGQCSYEQMLERGIVATRQLAKRQFTWLRSWSDVHWLESLDRDNLSRALKYLASVTILT